MYAIEGPLFFDELINRESNEARVYKGPNGKSKSFRHNKRCRTCTGSSYRMGAKKSIKGHDIKYQKYSETDK